MKEGHNRMKLYCRYELTATGIVKQTRINAFFAISFRSSYDRHLYYGKVCLSKCICLLL